MKPLPLVLALVLLMPFAAHAADDKQDAIAVLEQNVKSNPNNPELWLHLGFAYRKVDQLEKSQEAFQKALALDPRNSTGLSMMAMIYEKKQQTPQALQAWKKYLEIETDPAKRQMAEKHIHQLSQ